jgi:hypothetical protein
VDGPSSLLDGSFGAAVVVVVAFGAVVVVVALGGWVVVLATGAAVVVVTAAARVTGAVVRVERRWWRAGVLVGAAGAAVVGVAAATGVVDGVVVGGSLAAPTFDAAQRKPPSRAITPTKPPTSAIRHPPMPSGCPDPGGGQTPTSARRRAGP